jgi:peptidoglycan/xylan/chitin deacetylase (PgdA/CDA1 family)
MPEDKSRINTARPKQSFWLVALVMATGMAGLWPQLTLRAVGGEPSQVFDRRTTIIVTSDIQNELNGLLVRIGALEDAQASRGIVVTDGQGLQNSLAGLQVDLSAGDFKAVRKALADLEFKVGAWQKLFEQRLAAREIDLNAPPPDPHLQLKVPILIYHKTPADFEKQLQHLKSRGYTAIDPDQLLAAFRRQIELPAKPVLITFDDGFSNQMQAFALLQKHQMKATFYIVGGGQASRWCIGSGRRYDQGYSCGDGYLNWDQVRQLDQSGLVTIGSHTVDHLNLASLTTEGQRFQIFEGKRQLEEQLGHPVRHLAYPYGGYTATTQALAKEAGFVTAVSTLPGTIHRANTLHSLHRTRNAYSLP